ncbi:MAG TPA: tRNA(His) guanylyltransferase Thg1 family protein [Pyrinomonadaceae bacterium]|nr:tRNA(His) guanylyltransferase Thg1 family protein [Pyrinomonadaceae bacterium]
MKFDELDAGMRVFETAHDYSVLPGIYMVARIDGRNFTRLTKEVHRFEAPYDERFRDMMIATTSHLMNCGFRSVYGYTQSDEISVLFHPQITTFDRKVRKYNSVLAGEASAKFSLLLGDHACFDCRISELPNIDYVVDYFRWRNEDAHRNALNGHCYWMLRKEGETVERATQALHRLSVAEKNELLWQRGINFNELPLWQKRGVGLYWETYGKPGRNPLTGEQVSATRRRLKTDPELPMKDDYGFFVRKLIEDMVAKEALDQ